MNEIQRHTDSVATTWMQASGLSIVAIKELSQFTHFVAQFFKCNAQDMWLFRGERALYETPLTPSILRVDTDQLTRNMYPDRSITDQSGRL